VARKYACIMAALGMTIVLIRCLRAGGAFESAILSAMFWALIYGFVGYTIGSIARNTVDESVRQKLEREIHAYKKQQAKP
jgi:nitric oxide reductase large subunit